MSYLNVKNRASSTLAADISDTDTSLSVASGEGDKFPTSNFMITIEDEILFCSSRSGDTLTVERGKEGTTAASHASGETVELRITAGTFQNLERGAGKINVETLSGDKTLTPGTDPIYQWLVPDTFRSIFLDTANAKLGDRFIIKNNGTSSAYCLNVKQGTTTLDSVWSGAIKEFIFDGNNWVSGSNGTGEDSDLANGVTLGYKSKGCDYGVSIGAHSLGNNLGVGIGYYADGSSNGVAIGYRASTNTQRFSIALGYYSRTERVGELSRNINGYDTDQENNIIIQGWEKQTADATPVEMLAGGQTGERFTIRANSVLAFTILITARDNTSGDCAAYKVEGAIKRDGSGNTAMLTTPTKTVIHEDDASWDVDVTADDDNDALKITVTGDADNTVQWAARMDGVETHF